MKVMHGKRPLWLMKRACPVHIHLEALQPRDIRVDGGSLNTQCYNPYAVTHILACRHGMPQLTRSRGFDRLGIYSGGAPPPELGMGDGKHGSTSPTPGWSYSRAGTEVFLTRACQLVVVITGD